MDQIKIQNLELYCHHGVFEEENKLGQRFLVSATLEVDTRKAGKTDHLEDSVNYGTISHLIKQQMQSNTYRLIERAAEQTAEAILLSDEKIKGVEIEVKKPWAPIGLPLETVSIAIRRTWHEAYIALGSNLGKRKQYLKQAQEMLQMRKDCRIKRVSSYIETEPYGVLEQPRFLNGVIRIETLLPPQELLQVLQEIEQQAHRVRTQHWGPRTLDLDLLFYDQEIIETEELCVPHPDLHNRDFVLSPMAEIAPYKHHPLLGKTMLQLWEELQKCQ